MKKKASLIFQLSCILFCTKGTQPKSYFPNRFQYSTHLMRINPPQTIFIIFIFFNSIMDFSSDELDSDDQENLCRVSNDDIYQEDSEDEIIPENMLIQRQRRNTGEIEQNCANVKTHILKISQIKRSSKANPIKKLVSKKKNRFNLDGFNLDLTQFEDITDQVIAMGFPAEDFEQFFRNSMSDVQRFFNSRHNGHYKIINLCSERKYKHSCFNNMVSEYPFEDHQAPPFEMIFTLCQEVDSWLKVDKKNVVAVHCKAGKGRTGLMICCYLLYSGMFKNSYECMRYYGAMRTNNKKGVTIPSQIRYVMYFEKALSLGMVKEKLPVRQIKVTRIKLITIPKFNFQGSCTPWYTIINKEKIHIQELGETKTQNDGFIDFHLNLFLEGDVKVVFYNKSILNKKTQMFQFWFNTIFFDQKLIIDKEMLDHAHKDRNNKYFSKNFRVELDGITIEKEQKQFQQK